MNLTDLIELAAGHALGALSPEDAARLKAALAQNTEALADVGSFHNVAAIVATTALETVVPPAGLRAKILERALRTPQETRPSETTQNPVGFQFVRNEESGWVSTAISGFRVKPLSLSRDMGYQVLLVELAAGTRFPEHDHQSSEELFIFSGHLHSEGRVLGPGDFLHAEPGTHHHELVSPDGCLALLVQRVQAAA